MKKDFIDQAFDRMNLQQIHHFLLYGTENVCMINLSNTEYLKQESEPLYSQLKNIYGENTDTCNDIGDDISRAMNAYAEIYTQIGMKVGARIVFELLQKDGKEPLEKRKSSALIID